ncbi:FMN-dependent NADH-azoreductase [Thauera linaloolentis]|uniref:FMN dependent NADH:quinone oxidoreductase n=1 Tax=Thauera linaloolentis (strain DSM 12138 / JCM 21573 / CCUG 41526 / CIP 105981 / IAM 15112 / NBRC 102519 / 47Lol) TaxID=1123367 RepID=N6Y8J2_THAL4|nr:NAD(P)H-dependent oxidoreductase [Thauera linaloolentis]ENO90621.1 NAD(P)H dehydrogenase (quinone) [Thauera linaloolentis 47Lol = DSM 12138]MCM8566127.1 NAD(P)H-dependent oxidoreductase [Thauera linaloolentis]
MNILQINGSARSEGANSTRVANGIVARLLAAEPQARVVLRDLARNPAPVIDEAALGALFTPVEQRTPEQAARVAQSDALIAEVQAADVIVLGVPMYNFGISSQLKNWIDAIARAGVTFRYTENGPEGLLKGKKALVAFARGGRYRGTPADTQTPYLQAVLGFVGITDVRFVYAEGLNMGEEAVQQGFAQAEADIEAVLG